MRNELYNLGFIPASDYISRLKQGLPTQDVANFCLYPGAICKESTLYPAQQIKMSPLSSISKNCPLYSFIF
jgi:hypothetical protein